MYSRDLIDDILKRADIVSVISNYLNVIHKGKSYVAICPFHDDKNPSLSISREKQIYKCFVCGNGGNAITFIQRYEKISFDEAVRKLAELINFRDPRLESQRRERKVDSRLEPLYACINDLQAYYAYSLNVAESEKAREYLKKRNIPSEQINKYGIGYAPNDGNATIRFLQAKGHSLKSIEDIGIADVGISSRDHNAGRLIFPLYDRNGQVVGFSARQLEKDGTAKYINSNDNPIFHKGSLLYNYHNVSQSAHRDGYCYLLEGFMDVMALDKAGLPNAIALMGTSLTGEQIALLRKLRCEIRVCLDGDNPGQTAMMKIIAQLSQSGVAFRLVSNPNDLRDPDEILQEEGPESLKAKMENLVDAYEFQINFYTNTKKLETQEDKRKVLLYFIPFLQSIPPGIDRENYVIKLSKATGYEPEAIYSELLRNGKREQSERAIYSDMLVEEQLHPDRGMPTSRLYKAERQVLYYMMNSRMASRYFEDKIGNFYSHPYELLANYLLEFRESHDEEIVDVASILGEISRRQEEGIEDLNDVLAKLSLDENYPPCSELQLERCKRTIDEEGAKIYDKTLAERALQGKSKDDKARIISDYGRQKMKRLQEMKEKRNKR
ncbi:MAG: DNA primase [Bacillota bacterium]|nr:DNA primase [Bacillota bacterium]